MSKETKDKKGQECCDLEACCGQAPSLLRQIADAIEKCCAPRSDEKSK